MVFAIQSFTRFVYVQPQLADEVHNEEMDTAKTLVSLYMGAPAAGFSAQPQLSNKQYGPVRNAKKKELKPYSRRPKTPRFELSDAAHDVFYSPGTTVRYKKRNREILSSRQNGEIFISNEEKKIPVSGLKPKIKIGDTILLLDKEDPFRRHFLAVVEKCSRGNIESHWVEFDQRKAPNQPMQTIDALARIIFIQNKKVNSSHKLNLLIGERVTCTDSDGTETHGIGYSLLKNQPFIG